MHANETIWVNKITNASIKTQSHLLTALKFPRKPEKRKFTQWKRGFGFSPASFPCSGWLSMDLSSSLSSEDVSSHQNQHIPRSYAVVDFVLGSLLFSHLSFATLQNVTHQI